MAKFIPKKSKTCSEEFDEECRNSTPAQWNNPAWHANIIKRIEFETTCGDEPIKVQALFMSTSCSVTVLEKFGSVWCQALTVHFNGHCSRAWPRIRRWLFGSWKKELVTKIEAEIDAHARGE